jgi:hypothetical protein
MFTIATPISSLSPLLEPLKTAIGALPRLTERVRDMFIFSFTHGFDRFGIERPATEAIGTRVSRGPVSYGHGQGTAGIAIVALLDQLRARRRLRIVLPKMELRPSKVQKPAGPSSG